MMHELREAIEETGSFEEIAYYLRSHLDEPGFDDAYEWLTGAFA